MFKAIILVLFSIPSARAAELFCSPAPVDVDFKVPTTVSKKAVSYGGERYGFVELRQRQARYKPYHSYTELRVSADGLEWSIMCVDQGQLAKLRELGYQN